MKSVRDALSDARIRYQNVTFRDMARRPAPQRLLSYLGWLMLLAWTLPVVAQAASVSFVAPESQVWENGGTTLDVTVALSEAIDSVVTVDYTIEGDAEAGSDFQTLSGSVAIPALQLAGVIAVNCVDDGAQEGVETIQFLDPSRNY